MTPCIAIAIVAAGMTACEPEDSVAPPTQQETPIALPDTPIYKGLRVGDRITHIDGEPVSEPFDFSDVRIESALADQDMAITVEREDGSVQTIVIKRTTSELNQPNDSFSD